MKLKTEQTKSEEEVQDKTGEEITMSEVTIDSDTLLVAIKSIMKIISKRSTIPSLDCVKFMYDGDYLKVSGSDLESELTFKLPLEYDSAHYSKKGEFLIEGKELLAHLNTHKKMALRFVHDKETENIEILSRVDTQKLSAIPFDEYPNSREFSENAKEGYIAASTIKEGIDKVSYCVAKDELRPVLNGINFEITKTGISIVGTDAHSLSFYSCAQESYVATSFILPKKPMLVLSELLKLHSKPTVRSLVLVKNDDKNVSFEVANNFTLDIRATEGKYPTFRAVLREKSPISVETHRKSFLEAIARVSGAANKASQLIRLAIKDGFITLSAQDIDFGRASAESVHAIIDGNDIEIGFNYVRLTNALKINDFERVKLLFDEPHRALEIKEKLGDDAELTSLVMPLTLPPNNA